MDWNEAMGQRRVIDARIALVGLLFVSVWASLTDAAELRIRAKASATGSLVLLGDVADVFDSDAAEIARLSKIELFPAPAPGEKSFLRAVEIRDALLLRNENLADCSFSGASQVTIVGPDVEIASSPSPKPVSAALRRKVDERVARLIAEHLAEQHPDSAPWLVEPQLIDEETATLAAALAITVTGFRTAQDGPTRFFLEVATQQRVERLTVFATAGPRPAVVVAARPLPRGVLIDASDVRLEPAPTNRTYEHAFRRIDEVVGRETTRSLVSGQVLHDELVQHPILVHRRDVVTVYARNGGIRIRTTGRAKDDGSLGELVSIESPADRQTFFARVSGYQEVEVYARAPLAGASGPANDAGSQVEAFSSRLRRVSALGNSPQSIGRQTPDRAAASNRPSRLNGRSIPSQASRGR